MKTPSLRVQRSNLVFFLDCFAALAMTALCLISCTPTPQSASFHAFGTEVTVQIEGVHPEKAQQLFANIDKQLQTMHRRWHAWQDSELSNIRQACQSGVPLQVSEDVAYLLQQGKIFEHESQGYFNPAIGELIDAWGFLSHTSTQERLAPSSEMIATLLSYQPSMQNIHITQSSVTCTNPHVRLDFGAYAKGYGVGLIMDYLKSQGVTQALVNAGGDLMILQAPGSKPKRIGIESPEHGNPETVLLVNENMSVFTSGTYARNFKDPHTQKRYHHLINPKTGHPSTDFISVTVMHPDPMRADAAATALLASDKESWLAITQAMGVTRYLLITAEGERISSL